MKKEVFEGKPMNQRVDELQNFGKFISWRIGGGMIVKLYILHNFIVESFQDATTFEYLYLKVFNLHEYVGQSTPLRRSA